MLDLGIYHSWWPYLNGLKKLPTPYIPCLWWTATILKCFQSGCQLWLIWKHVLYQIVQSLYLSRITSITSPHLNICISMVALNYAKNIIPMLVSFGPKYNILKMSSLKNHKSWRKKKTNRNDLLTHISVEGPLATPGRGSGMVKREKRGDHDVWLLCWTWLTYWQSILGEVTLELLLRHGRINSQISMLGFSIVHQVNACVCLFPLPILRCAYYFVVIFILGYLLWSPLLPVIFILLLCCRTAIFGVVLAFYKVILLTFYWVLLIHNISVILHG